jgi:hypothetical protein
MIVMAGRKDLEKNEDYEPPQRHRGLEFFTFLNFGIPKKFLISKYKKNTLRTTTKI